MRYVAITAALVGGALVLALNTSPVSAMDTLNIKNIINRPSISTVASNKTSNVSNVEIKAQTASTEQKTISVAGGDNLSKLAEANGTTYQRLYYANTSVVDPDLIYPGQQLRVPTSTEELTPRPLPENVPEKVKEEVRAETAQPAAQAPAAYIAPAPRPVTTQAPAVSGSSVWDSLAACESGGNWAINTGNGFYGGLQFTLSSWAAVGGSGYPNQASREEQIMRGQILQSRQGWGAWPACTTKLGIY